MDKFSCRHHHPFRNGAGGVLLEILIQAVKKTCLGCLEKHFSCRHPPPDMSAKHQELLVVDEQGAIGGDPQQDRNFAGLLVVLCFLL